MYLRAAMTIFAALTCAVVSLLAASAIQPKQADAADTVIVRSCIGTDIALQSAEKRMLDLHNLARRDNGLARLCIHPQLQRAARAHSQDMIARDFFGHTNPSGQTYLQRIRATGYRPTAAAENIAGGSGPSATPDNRFAAWMGSAHHKDNILRGTFKEVGVGAAAGDYKGNPAYVVWTVDFGAR